MEICRTNFFQIFDRRTNFSKINQMINNALESFINGKKNRGLRLMMCSVNPFNFFLIAQTFLKSTKSSIKNWDGVFSLKKNGVEWYKINFERVIMN